MKFALITEGASEHRVIKHIISKYFKDKEPDINQIQPKIVNDKQEAIGGWNEVLKYCEREELKDILVENDYLVIQIDTDKSATNPFNVSHSSNGQAKTDKEFYADVVAKLRGGIKPEIIERYSDKILFAICIHTIECWLLPLYYKDNHKTNTNNCLTALNRALGVNNIRIIPVKNKNSPNAIQAYNTILGEMKRKTDINSISKHNVGFKNFVESLNTIEVE